VEEAARLLQHFGAERVLGRWMRMVTIPNQSSVPKAYMEFDEADRMKPSAYYDRVGTLSRASSQ
jgi:NAD(P)H-dependent FMN reductase